ncbi:MAG TPA: hypothetical protein VKA18_06465 [Alphaproteobacteria bacterium]|nr:hypothetical protein [Alphaproteobacteria bacterium]
MIAGFAVASILAFLVVFWLIGVVPEASKAVATASGAARIVASKELDDDTKEREAQRAAIGLLKGVFSILWRSAVAFVAAAVPVYSGDAFGLVSADAVAEFLSRWDMIVIASVVIVAGYLAAQRLWPAR